MFAFLVALFIFRYKLLASPVNTIKIINHIIISSKVYMFYKQSTFFTSIAESKSYNPSKNQSKSPVLRKPKVYKRSEN